MGKKRTEKRQPTAEEKSRKVDYRLKHFISKSAIELADRDDEVKRQMVAQTFGYKLPDPAEKSERELLACINELTIRRIKEDPELARRITDARILQVAEKLGLNVAGEEQPKKPLTIKELIEKFQEINELKEVLGVKEPRWFDAFLDPKVIAVALQLASGLLGNKQAPPANNMVVLVSKDGEEREITRQEYEQLKARDNIANLKDAEIGEPISPGSGSDTASEPDTSSKAEEGDGETGAAGSGK